MQITNTTDCIINLREIDADGNGRTRPLSIQPHASVLLCDYVVAGNSELNKLIRSGVLSISGSTQPDNAPAVQPALTAGASTAPVTLTGVPSVGQVPTATSATAASWQTPVGGGIANSVVTYTVTHADIVSSIYPISATEAIVPLGTFPQNAIMSYAYFEMATPFTGGAIDGATDALQVGPMGNIISGGISTSIAFPLPTINMSIVQPAAVKGPGDGINFFDPAADNTLGITFSTTATPLADLTAGHMTLKIVFLQF